MTIRILVAEDEENIRLALKTIVRKNLTCDEVIACEDGQAAWDQLQTGSFGMVISDWNMPRMTGFDLLEAMRGDDKTKHIPLLLLTARSGKTSVINALQADANDYVTKPFDKDALVQKAKKLLAKAQAIRASNEAAASAQASPTHSISEEIVTRIRMRTNFLARVARPGEQSRGAVSTRGRGSRRSGETRANRSGDHLEADWHRQLAAVSRLIRDQDAGQSDLAHRLEDERELRLGVGETRIV